MLGEGVLPNRLVPGGCGIPPDLPPSVDAEKPNSPCWGPTVPRCFDRMSFFDQLVVIHLFLDVVAVPVVDAVSSPYFKVNFESVNAS